VNRELLPMFSIIDAVSVCPSARGAMAAAVANATEDFMVIMRKNVYGEVEEKKQQVLPLLYIRTDAGRCVLQKSRLLIATAWTARPDHDDPCRFHDANSIRWRKKLTVTSIRAESARECTVEEDQNAGPAWGPENAMHE